MHKGLSGCFYPIHLGLGLAFILTSNSLDQIPELVDELKGLLGEVSLTDYFKNPK